MKWDGFRALAHVNGAGTKLFSRRGLEYRSFDDLASMLSLELNADDAVLDGEIVKLDENGCPIFADLIRRHGPFVLVAFDVLAVNGKDVRAPRLVQRKKLLRAIVPARSSSLLYAQHVSGSGCEVVFSVICAQDLEGIVAKRKDSRTEMSWLRGSKSKIGTTAKRVIVTSCSSAPDVAVTPPGTSSLQRAAGWHPQNGS